MSKKLILVFILFICISCGNRTNGPKHSQEKEPEEKNEQTSNSKLNERSKVIPKKIHYENFDVVYKDFYGDRLQRVFITIASDDIYETLILKSIICEIKKMYKIDKKSSISFFSESKYADYKTTLFIDEGHLFPLEEYENWMNFYYLAEYDFETNEYRTYPVCRKNYKRRKTIKVECN